MQRLQATCTHEVRVSHCSFYLVVVCLFSSKKRNSALRRIMSLCCWLLAHPSHILHGFTAISALHSNPCMLCSSLHGACACPRDGVLFDVYIQALLQELKETGSEVWQEGGRSTIGYGC